MTSKHLEHPHSAFAASALSTDINHHRHHFEHAQAEEHASQHHHERMRTNSHNYKITASTISGPAEKSLYEEMLPFQSVQLPINVAPSSNVVSSVNDNNNNSLLVSTQQQKTASPSKNISNEVSVQENGNSGMISQIPVSMNNDNNVEQNVNDLSNKNSEDSSKSESFEVDW